MQSLVRIYNRQHLLTWLQDVEFARLRPPLPGRPRPLGHGRDGRQRPVQPAQRARRRRRRRGPWRDQLTEDQDLGLRLIAAGWEGRQDLRATVDQQGLSKLRPLFRQRTRWSQGNLQAIALRGEVLRAPVSAAAPGSSSWPTC